MRSFCAGLLGLFTLWALPGGAHASDVYRLTVGTVTAQELMPVKRDAGLYPSLPAAQAAVIKLAAQRAIFSFDFKLPESLCGREDVGIYMGVIYDQDRAFLNSELIGITADPEHVDIRKTGKARLYLLPKRLLKCGQANTIKIDVRSLVGKRLGPFGGDIRVGPWWELERPADLLQEYMLFFREIGLLILSVTFVLFGLFWKYSFNRRQMAFVSFAFWAGLMCVSLSGWLFSLIGYPALLYAVHAALVCTMLVELSRLIALYAERGIVTKLSHFWSGTLSFACFCVFFSYLPSVNMVQVYRFILLAFIMYAVGFLFYAHVHKYFRGKVAEGIFLWLVVIGVISDTLRIWGLHSGQNISAYLVAVSVVGLGLVLARELVGVFKTAADAQRIRYEKERFELLSDMAMQVAHDIRSPLAALDVALNDLSALPPDKRELASGAVGRIGEIARDLLENYKSPGGKSLPVGKAVSPQELKTLIEPILYEKRAQHSSKPGVVIEYTAQEVYAAVQPTELRRIVSNLVNNAVEAFESVGKVAVDLSRLDGKVLLKVSDNGKGIPAEILAKLGRRGETHGKAGGTGLGLYHARTSVESWGGMLNIDSKPGSGTAVTIELPAIEDVKFPKTVVLVDDDALVRMNWKTAAKGKGIALQAFSSPDAFLAIEPPVAKDTPIYLDSDLGDGVKGEDIAQSLKEKGYSNICLETGHSTEKFSHIPWLKVIGKEPPWQ
ncbi:MAG TPA: hypothetical protein DCS63_04840 [Elusimicrobia bacterium]|nr:hypothetical protein [Elusimicrobiota bacterium]